MIRHISTRRGLSGFVRVCRGVSGFVEPGGYMRPNKNYRIRTLLKFTATNILSDNIQLLHELWTLRNQVVFIFKH